MADPHITKWASAVSLKELMVERPLTGSMWRRPVRAVLRTERAFTIISRITMTCKSDFLIISLETAKGEPPHDGSPLLFIKLF